MPRMVVSGSRSVNFPASKQRSHATEKRGANLKGRGSGFTLRTPPYGPETRVHRYARTSLAVIYVLLVPINKEGGSLNGVVRTSFNVIFLSPTLVQVGAHPAFFEQQLRLHGD